MHIITRGYGGTTVITRGYGPSGLILRIRAEVFRAYSRLTKIFEQVSKIATRD